MTFEPMVSTKYCNYYLFLILTIGSSQSDTDARPAVIIRNHGGFRRLGGLTTEKDQDLFEALWFIGHAHIVCKSSQTNVNDVGIPNKGQTSTLYDLILISAIYPIKYLIPQRVKRRQGCLETFRERFKHLSGAPVAGSGRMKPKQRCWR